MRLTGEENAVVAFDGEWKYRTREGGEEEFLRAIEPKLSSRLYDPERPFSWTRTTYLDTADLDYFRSSATGVSRRLRIREYASARTIDAPPLLTGECFLELKESSGFIRTKERLGASPSRIDALVRSAGTAPAVPGEPGSWKLFRERLRQDRPIMVLTTFYRRSAWAAESDRIRITLDRELHFAAPSGVGEAGDPARPSGPVERLEGHVIEIKYRGEAPEWLARARRLLPEPESFSKFRTGMRLLRPGAESSVRAESGAEVG